MIHFSYDSPEMHYITPQDKHSEDKLADSDVEMKIFDYNLFNPQQNNEIEREKLEKYMNKNAQQSTYQTTKMCDYIPVQELVYQVNIVKTPTQLNLGSISLQIQLDHPKKQIQPKINQESSKLKSDALKKEVFRAYKNYWKKKFMKDFIKVKRKDLHENYEIFKQEIKPLQEKFLKEIEISNQQQREKFQAEIKSKNGVLMIAAIQYKNGSNNENSPLFSNDSQEKACQVKKYIEILDKPNKENFDLFFDDILTRTLFENWVDKKGFDKAVKKFCSKNKDDHSSIIFLMMRQLSKYSLSCKFSSYIKQIITE
ncbi:UNKNOWN [Stylonychia lemnae]|uniref:Uncharacterized protein n=1 Tax=Stylonychia lemnae TaxID=5949 RepID=A0A078A6R3_STYLE|nr:UNKNOWN [Stylonychia lemnae]|eukprot:CDW77879.1 UNKNOWN [Stylonychia lemnae]